MEIWKIVFLTSFIVAVVRCDDKRNNMAKNEVELENINANLIRQKKSPQIETYPAYPPVPYKPTPPAYYGPPSPPKSTYSVPPPQSLPHKSVYAAPASPVYRTYDMMDQQQGGVPEMMNQHYMHVNDLMEQVGTYQTRRNIPTYIPYQPAPAPIPITPAPVVPSQCGQQFRISCTPHIYAIQKTPHYQPTYYPTPPPYAPHPPPYAPSKPVYTPSPTVYAPEPAYMYAVQAQASNNAPQNMPNTSADPKMVNNNASTAPSTKNETPSQQNTHPKEPNVDINEIVPPTPNNKTKLPDQVVPDKDKKLKPKTGNFSNWWDKPI